MFEPGEVLRKMFPLEWAMTQWASNQRRQQVSDVNAVVMKLSEIVQNAGNIHIAHGRRTYAISDPACPYPKVIAYVKTQLEKMVPKAAVVVDQATKEATATE